MDIETVMLFRSALYSVAGMVDTFFGRATGRALQEMECGPTLDGTEDRPRSASHPNGRPGLRWVSEEERRAFIEHHHDVAADGLLRRDAALRAQAQRGLIHVALELRALLADGTATR